jgi:hypothetical protein
LPSEAFEYLKAGTVGTVKNTETGNVWQGEFVIIGKRVKGTTPPRELLTVESIAKRVQRIPGNLSEGRPDTFLPTEDAFERCEELPIEWFTPKADAPAAAAPVDAAPVSTPAPAPALVKAVK